ncbi:hypothetical protein LX32DRAFT_112716 [Colletotrichum zoysiae]|uniref:Uncharacterized protein n=1 Tax=Colletotrichum zoysiae TaxID=1216348 RepID=A0AAD9HA46_9PEZI|nr:hypothetical protein LX32DRAFT_112716 [Colletotrichum zoysiae]
MRELAVTGAGRGEPSPLILIGSSGRLKLASNDSKLCSRIDFLISGVEFSTFCQLSSRQGSRRVAYLLQTK